MIPRGHRSLTIVLVTTMVWATLGTPHDIPPAECGSSVSLLVAEVSQRMRL
jgi:hypothetical protein